MRERHADMFVVDGKRRQTITIPDSEEREEDSDTEDMEDGESESD